MTIYNPDKWVVLEILGTDRPLYKVFGTWVGGYTGSDSWRINSGITRCEKVADTNLPAIEFFGESGSSYICNTEMYGIAGLYNLGILQPYLDNGSARIMPEDTNWTEFTYV